MESVRDLVVVVDDILPLLANVYLYDKGMGQKLRSGQYRNSPIGRASLGTIFSQGIFIFPWENELISLGKMEIPWKNSVPKLARRGLFSSSFEHSVQCIEKEERCSL
jgi:hypothetical protein